jgi:hypothetical protein
MTFLWILLGIVYIACWIYFGLATFRKGALLDVLDRILPAHPVDNRRVHRTDVSSRRQGLGAAQAGTRQATPKMGES